MDRLLVLARHGQSEWNSASLTKAVIARLDRAIPVNTDREYWIARSSRAMTQNGGYKLLTYAAPACPASQPSIARLRVRPQ